MSTPIVLLLFAAVILLTVAFASRRQEGMRARGSSPTAYGAEQSAPMVVPALIVLSVFALAALLAYLL